MKIAKVMLKQKWPTFSETFFLDTV